MPVEEQLILYDHTKWSIDAMEKQLPKRVKIELSTRGSIVRCPVCDMFDIEMDYCPNCGQRLER